MTAIDISYWQHHPDFAQVKASGVSLVIMKATDGEAGYLAHDSVYVANRAAARAQGLAVGAYFFNGPVDPTAAADDLFAASDYHPGDILAIDVEDFSGGTHWNPGQVAAWCSRLISAHAVPAQSILVYMNTSALRGAAWGSVSSLGVGLWVAQYGSNDGTPQGSPEIGSWSAWSLWQYSSVGTVPGISGHIDMNLMAGGFASLGSTPITSTNGYDMPLTDADAQTVVKTEIILPAPWGQATIAETLAGTRSRAEDTFAVVNAIAAAVAALKPAPAPTDVKALAAAIAALIPAAAGVPSDAGVLTAVADLKAAILAIPKASTSGTITFN